MSSIGLRGMDTSGSGGNAFTWHNIMSRYQSRPSDLSHLNLYHYVCKHWANNERTTPQLFGFHDIVTWPLIETYAKYNLVFF